MCIRDSCYDCWTRIIGPYCIPYFGLPISLFLPDFPIPKGTPGFCIKPREHCALHSTVHSFRSCLLEIAFSRHPGKISGLLGEEFRIYSGHFLPSFLGPPFGATFSEHDFRSCLLANKDAIHSARGSQDAYYAICATMEVSMRRILCTMCDHGGHDAYYALCATMEASKRHILCTMCDHGSQHAPHTMHYVRAWKP